MRIMCANIVEPDEVPVVVHRGGLFYFSRHGVELSAYRPAEMLELGRRIDAAYKAWCTKPCVVIRAKRKRSGH